jgi:hypothetical protein
MSQVRKTTVGRLSRAVGKATETALPSRPTKETLSRSLQRLEIRDQVRELFWC